ncbi:uncharacterized protein [Elaeis guineensis]|uniref:uncharacterized protein n=1 Tax=Elaeis guineensis var. tenera TaxID=51953 RepID=UPI003C6D9D0D
MIAQDNWWILHVDRTSNSQGSDVGLIIANPNRVAVEYTLRFNFSTTNNMAKYEAHIIGLKITKELDADEVKVFSDSQLIVSQVQDEYEAKDLTMSRYLQKIMDLSMSFKKWDIQRIPSSENA